MSIRIMSQIFDSEELGPTARLIMLALADHADDTGRCYPAIGRLCARTGLKERAIQKHISELEEAGYLRVLRGQGPRGTNVFFVSATPAYYAPPHDVHPAPDAPPPRTTCTPTPARRAPKPSVTIKEPSVPPLSPVDILATVVRTETAKDFAIHRKAMKKPLTEVAAKRLAKSLAKCPDPDAAVDLSIANGWQGVFPEKIQGGRYDGPYTNRPDSGRSQNRPDVALEQIARLAGLSEA